MYFYTSPNLSSLHSMITNSISLVYSPFSLAWSIALVSVLNTPQNTRLGVSLSTLSLKQSSINTGLQPSPARRLRGACPHLFHSYKHCSLQCFHSTLCHPFFEAEYNIVIFPILYELNVSIQ